MKNSQSGGKAGKSNESGYAPVNGIKMYYEIYGEGKPIILLHGAFMTIQSNWGALIPELSKTRKVIAIEMQGHGRTEFSERVLSRPDLASDIEVLMDYLKIESADVLGYSLGGSVAYQFAIQFPKRLRKLIIISATHKTTGWLPEVARAFKTRTAEQFTSSPLKAQYDAVAPDKTKWTKFIDQMIVSGATDFDLGDDNISKISAPTLIISGDNDGMDKMELIKTYRLLGGDISADFGEMPKSQLAIVPGQTHWNLMAQTKTIMSYLNDFLK